MTLQAVKLPNKFVEMSHGKTRYLEAGSGYPTILIHGAGWTSGAESWLLNMGPLSEKYRVLAIDCLNWGPGDVFDQEFSFGYLVDFVREFMDVMGIEKANIVGHSMGGWIATLLAYESPERINKLVLVAPGGTATRPLQNMVDFKAPTKEQLQSQFESRYAGRDVDVAPIVDLYWQKAETPGHVDAFAKVMKHMTNPMTRTRYNTLRRLQHIHVPTLVVWGRDDKTNDFSMSEQVTSGIKGSKLVAFDNCGHGVPTEKPEEFNKAVLDFLA